MKKYKLNLHYINLVFFAVFAVMAVEVQMDSEQR